MGCLGASLSFHWALREARLIRPPPMSELKLDTSLTACGCARDFCSACQRQMCFQTVAVAFSPGHLNSKLRADLNPKVIVVAQEQRLTLLRKQRARSSGFSVHLSNSFRKVLRGEGVGREI